MIAKLIIVLFLIAILCCLASALYYLFSGRGNSRSMVKALTVRIVLSVILFALLMLGFLTGVLHPRSYQLFVPKSTELVQKS